MAIIHRTGGGGEGLTGGSRALELFTDREELILRFLAAMHDDPPPSRILFFTGDGGNGKSLLLRCLSRHYCRRLRDRANWEWVRALPAEETLAQVREAEDAEDVPWALLDFGMQPRGDDRPQEGFSALLMLNRMLTARDLRFPVFEFACVWYLYKTDRLTDEKLRELFPSDVMDFITEIAGTVSQTSWAYLANSILRIFDTQMSEHVTLYQYQRGLKVEQIEAIQRMDPEGELIDQLPRLWAQDLNTAMTLENAPERVVLFFDTHEAFWGSERGLSEDLYFQYDEWLRSLLVHLELANGVVVAVAGREAPRWAQAPTCAIPPDCVDLLPVGHFCERDAHRYLVRAGVGDVSLRRALIARARVRRNEVHPFFLGLTADLAETAARRGTPLRAQEIPRAVQEQDRGRALVMRLLRYVDAEIGVAVRALCACRSFDRAIHALLGKAVGFQATEGSFAVLRRFSFVWDAPRGGEGWFRIHDLLRRLVREEGDEIVARADRALEAHYEARARAGDSGALAEVAYHASQLEPERGAARWVAEFEGAVADGRHDVCRALLEVWTELRVAGAFARGRMLDAQGDWFARTAEPEEAEESFQEAIAEFDRVLAAAPDDRAAHQNRGNSLLGLGDLQASRTQHDAAQASYAAAIEAFGRALARAPEDAAGHNNLGNAWARLGRLQGERGHPEEALESHRKAEAAYAEALRRAPDDRAARENAGNALQGMGETLAALGRREEALESYRKAIAAYRDPHGHARGNALSRLGDLYESMERLAEAEASYREAMASFEAARARAPEDLAAHNNAGNAFQGLARILAALGRDAEAEEQFRRATAAYAEALRRAPEYAAAHGNAGLAWLGLARLRADRGEIAAAEETYGRAAAAFQEALYRAPNEPAVLLGKARALHRRAELLVALDRPEAAARTWRKAIQAYDTALLRSAAPAHRDRGDALAAYAELLEQTGKPQDARRAWSRAVAAYTRALSSAPEDAGLWRDKGGALVDLAEVLAALGRPEEAQAQWRRAARAFAEAAKRAPADASLPVARGAALAQAAEALLGLRRETDAANAFTEALAAFDAALAAGLEAASLRNRRGYSLIGLGQAHAAAGRGAEAAQAFQRALAEFRRSLELEPGSEAVREMRDQLAATWEEEERKRGEQS